MTDYCFAMLSNGEIPDAGVDVLTGVIVLAVIATIFLGLFVQLKSIRKKAKDEYDAQLAKKEAEIREKVNTENTLKDLKDSIDRLSQSFTQIGTGLGARLDHNEIEQAKLSREFDRICRILVSLEASTKAAHKRIDEHRHVDHGFQSQSYRDNITSEAARDAEDHEEGWN